MTTHMTRAAASGDADLVQACLAGNREAFGDIVSRYQSLVCSLAYSATGSLSQSEDLAQETFLAAWKHLAGLREPMKLRAWLCGIAQNLINQSRRAEGREPSNRAERLDGIPEPRSAEPLPVERAISHEEAEILWRSLEGIPETYRLPLVLFYREHQSIGAVAQHLELTEEAVRQRLSRGRKLLQEEVLAFVESALEKTAPGKAFTVAVVATLPIAVTSAKAASVGVAAAKGAAGAKTAFSLAALGSLAAGLGAWFFYRKTMVDDSKSPGERKFVARMLRYGVGFFVIVLLGTMALSVSVFPHHPWASATAAGVLLLASLVGQMLAMSYLTRRRLEIRADEGADLDQMPGRAGIRRTIMATMPMLLLVAGGGLALPWKQHWLRCATVMAAYALLSVWLVRKVHRPSVLPIPPRLSRLHALLGNPLIAAIWLLLNIGAVFCLLKLFLPSAIPGPEIPWSEELPSGLGPVIAALACAVLLALFLVLLRKLAPRSSWLARILDTPWLRALRLMPQGPETAAERTYAPLFQQLHLPPDQQAQLTDLVRKRMTVLLNGGRLLLNRELDAARRADLTRQIDGETAGSTARIKDCLGQEHYAAFRQFERTVADRMLIDRFNRRLAGTSTALSPEQQGRLLQALADARAQFPWTTDLSRRNFETIDYDAHCSDESLDTFAREEEQFDRQFLTQLEPLLSPEQLAALQETQKQQRRSQLAQFTMAARAFAPKNADSNPVLPRSINSGKPPGQGRAEN